MLTEWGLTLSPLIALVVNVCMQMISIHLSHRTGLSIIIGLLIGWCVALVLLCILSNSYFIMDCGTCFVSYLALSFCFWAFLNLNITSLRIRILRELLKESQGLKTDVLLQYYSPNELIKKRILRLEALGQIRRKNGKWVLHSRKLLVLVWVTSLLRNLITPFKVLEAARDADRL